ncbi:MAG: citrate/2-methylcitrate synthase [Patescibacteria group bacterium]
MTILESIRKGRTNILVIGNHPGIIQSVLDFDFLSGKREPSILGIVAGNRKAEKYFFGTQEVLLPCYKNIQVASETLGSKVDWMLNLQSGRRTYDSTVSFFNFFQNALGAHIFAENVPESHATKLTELFGAQYFIVGPSGVGLLVPGALKLGAIGGVDAVQIKSGALTSAGTIAVGSTSGGMTNELIHATAKAGKRISFAIAIGGDRFPVVSLTQIFTLAENDPHTKGFVYFGELGGVDEYEIIELIKTKKFTKPLVAYIAGVIDEAFDEHVQFGHAKALVQTMDESARAKREALREAGVIAPDTFPQFLKELQKLPGDTYTESVMDIQPLQGRQKSILSTRKVLDVDEGRVFVKGKKLLKGKDNAFVEATLGALLGKSVRSPITLAFTEAVFEMLIDHGGNVSGAVNTMITARAGKDLVSSLASGLLTVGPRFGGAINEAASLWISGVVSQKTGLEFVAEKAKAGGLILGIGHKKYRIGLPDPRVKALGEFATLLKKHPHYDFARSVEKATTSKNGKLILNIDGAIAALLLDILSECEGMSERELQELADAEFFNAFFVIPRSVGFIAHFMEQKKNDEGLFRLPDELLFVRESAPKKGKKK